MIKVQKAFHLRITHTGSGLLPTHSFVTADSITLIGQTSLICSKGHIVRSKSSTTTKTDAVCGRHLKSLIIKTHATHLDFTGNNKILVVQTKNEAIHIFSHCHIIIVSLSTK